MGKAVSNQQAYWFRNDDGGETGATWKTTGSNMDVSLETGLANRFRIRIVVDETAGGTFNLNGRIYYSLNGGAYTSITTGSAVIPAHSSENDGWTITDEDNTTQQMAYGGTFITGSYADDGYASTQIILDTQHTEVEYCLYIHTDITGSSTIDLRVYDDTAALDNYNQTARITVLETAVPQTVTLNELTLASSTEAIFPAPGEIIVGANELTLASTIEALIVSEDFTVILDELTLNASMGDGNYTAVEFDDVNTIIVAGEDSNLDDIPDNYPFTFETWFRFDSGPNSAMLVNKGYNNNPNAGWWLWVNEDPNRIQGWVTSSGTWANSTSSPDEFYASGSLYHLVMYYDRGGDNQIYFAINGQWADTYNAQTALTGDYRSEVGRRLTIGGRHTEWLVGDDPGQSPTDVLDGAIHWAAIWDSDYYNHETDFTPPALNAPPATGSSGLIAVWPIDENWGSVVNEDNNDVAGSMFNGTWSKDHGLTISYEDQLQLDELTLASSSESLNINSIVSVVLNELSLASSTEAIIPAIADLTVTLNELTLASSLETLQILLNAAIIHRRQVGRRWIYLPQVIGGEVEGIPSQTVQPDTLTLSSSLEAITLAPGAVSLLLSELSLASSPEQIQVIAGEIATILNELTLIASAEQLTLSPGGISTTLAELILNSSLETLTVLVGQVNILLDELTLTSSAETLSVTSALTLVLSTLTLAGSPESITLVPGSVSAILNELNLTGSAEGLTVSPGEVIALLSELTLSSSTEGILITPGEAVAILSELILASSAEDITLIPGAITTILQELTLTSSAEDLIIALGAAGVVLNELTLASSLESLQDVIPGDIALLVNTLTLASTAEILGVIAGISPVVLTTLSLASTLEALNIIPGAVALDLSTLTLVSNAENLSVLAGILIALNELALSASAVSTTIVPGDISIVLSSINLAGEPQQITVVPGNVNIVASSLNLISSLEAITVAIGAVSLTLSELTLTGSAPNITLVPGAISITLDELTATFTAEQLTLFLTSAVGLDTLSLTSSLENILLVPGATSVQVSALLLQALVQDLGFIGQIPVTEFADADVSDIIIYLAQIFDLANANASVEDLEQEHIGVADGHDRPT